ncbi:hypothetical protein TcYC6_0122190 [Trypanosoma cruzi]|nr:hypothetical protein TcYC6_0122190 [Trypanosoma cruzi]
MTCCTDPSLMACMPCYSERCWGAGRNYGATQISVWSLARALDPAVPVLSPAVTPSMEVPDARCEWTDGAAADRRHRRQRCLLALLLIALILLLLHFCRDSRDNENAPKERTDPVTLVFTDIESSTALWAACPEAMPDAVATHHRLIRSLIAKVPLLRGKDDRRLVHDCVQECVRRRAACAGAAAGVSAAGLGGRA